MVLSNWRIRGCQVEDGIWKHAFQIKIKGHAFQIKIPFYDKETIEKDQ